MAEKTVPEIKKETVPTREGTRTSDQFMPPRVDIYQTKDGLEVLADLPGIEKDAVNVRVEQGILTIEGKASESGNANNYIYREFEPVNYFRQFELSEEVDQDHIAADFRHGVLKLTLPRAAKAKPRQIEVKVSQ